MLGAKVDALTTKLLVDSLSVRRSELDFYSFSLNAIILATTAIYLGALSVWGGYLFPVDHYHWNYPSRWLYHTVMIGGMMIQFLCLIVAIIAVIMAPGLALRGPPGSMDKAIQGMEYLTGKLSQAMIVSLGLFQIAMMIYCWTQEPDGIEGEFTPFPIYVSSLANAAFLLGLVLAGWYGRSIYNSLFFDRNMATADITGAASHFANKAISNALNPQQQQQQQSAQPQYQTFGTTTNYRTPDAAAAENAIRSVATKPKAKGFFKQIWDGSA